MDSCGRAIVVKYLPATDTKGPRLKASLKDGPSITIGYPHNGREPEQQAATRLHEKLVREWGCGWCGELAGGIIRDGLWAFVIVKGNH